MNDHVRKIAKLITEDPDILAEGKCPRCGGNAYQGLNQVECATPSCVNYSPKQREAHLKERSIQDPTLEPRLIEGNMDPNEVKELVRGTPNHGNFEAGEKIYTIYAYGNSPTRGRQTTPKEELDILKKYWNVDPQQVYEQMKDRFGDNLTPEAWQDIEELINELIL